MFYYIHTCRNDARTKAKNPGALTTTKPTKIPIGLKLHRIPKQKTMFFNERPTSDQDLTVKIFSSHYKFSHCCDPQRWNMAF